MLKPTRLTKKVVDALPAVGPKGKRYYVRDTGVRGLMLAINRLGSKTWKVQRDLYRNGKLVKTVRVSIGQWPDMDVDRARTRANEVIAQIKKGIDPSAPPEQPADSVLTWTVERLYQEYEEHMRVRNCRARSIEDVKWRMETYLPDWKSRLIPTLTKAECRARHAKITDDIARRHKRGDGKRTANQVLKELKWALNFAASICEDNETLPSNPVAAVTMHKERAANRSISFDDLPEWWKKVQALPNPLRRRMHTLALLSGLRPGTLVTIRRNWIALDSQTILIPHTHMKSDKPFALPLSNYMCDVVRSALAAGDMLFPETEWLFPTRTRDGLYIIATQVWKEKALPSETGHILRHTYRTIAETTTIQPSYRKLLLDHALPGMDAIYVDRRQLFRDLLASQEIMTDAILNLCKAPASTSKTSPAEAALARTDAPD